MENGKRLLVILCHCLDLLQQRPFLHPISIENLGDNEIHNLIVELKAPAAPLAE